MDNLFTLILWIIELPFAWRRASARSRARASWTARSEMIDARFRLGEIDEATWRMERVFLGQPPDRS